jgi:hypothetical protein
MSLSFGLWTVLGTEPTGRITCRCVCGAIVEADLAALDESSTCCFCGHRPLATRQHDLRAEQARQLPFDFGGGQS